MHHRDVANICLLETHRKATKVLEFAEIILHQMTPLIHLRVVLDLMDNGRVEKEGSRTSWRVMRAVQGTHSRPRFPTEGAKTA